ncbi:hypothetical protein ACHAXT_011050 [Thalassiosira profunda]
MDGHGHNAGRDGARVSKKIRRSDSSDSVTTVRSQMLAMQQYQRSASHASMDTTSSMDTSDDLSSKNTSKKSAGPLKKRRRIAADSESEEEGNAGGIVKKGPGGPRGGEGDSNNDARQKKSSGAPPKRKKEVPVSSGVKAKGELKPLLKVGQEVVAAWWESPEKRRTNSESSWYDGRIRAVKETDKGSDYGPVRFYCIDYDDGDELDEVLDIFVMPREDYHLSVEREQKPVGVETVVDKFAPADDRYARTIGWYTANIDGEDCSFSLLSEAMRAYDSSVVRRKVEKTRPCDLNLPDEWEWTTPEWNEATLSSLVGFAFNEEKSKYRVKMAHGGKDRNVGHYKLASDAARAYDEALKLLKECSGGANFISEKDHKDARAFEMRSTGLLVDYEKVRGYMLSKIEGIISKIERAEAATAVLPGTIPITSLRDNDVLSGRGKQIMHPGNVHFRSVADSYIAEYIRSDKGGRANIAAKIVASIRSEGGRFLKENGRDSYLEIGDELACGRVLGRLKNASGVSGDDKNATKSATSLSPSSIAISTPHNHDVLMGGVAESKEHPGNIFYRKLVDTHKEERAGAAQTVVSIIRSLTPPGRFLKKDTGEGGSWVELSEEQAISNLKNALYDAGKRRAGSGKSPSSPSSLATNKSTEESAVPSREKPKETKKQSSFVGVSWSKKAKKWQSHCYYKKQIGLGHYDLEADAAYARDEAKRLLKLELELAFATVEDYKRAVKRELRQTGLGRDAAWSAAAIESKVAGIASKHQKDKSARAEDKTAVAMGPPADHPELVALNESLEKKWARYLPKTSGQQFREEYQREIDGILDDLETPRVADSRVPSTVSVGNGSSLAGSTANVSAGQRSNPSTLQMQPGEPVAAHDGKELIEAEAAKAPAQKVAVPLGSSVASSAKQPPARTEKVAAIEPAKETKQPSPEARVVPAEPPKRREIERMSLMRLSKGQAADLPFPSGCNVWFEFGTSSSFRTGVVANAHLDLLSRDLVYEVELAGGGGTTELVSEHDLLAYAPRCPVYIASAGDDANPSPGEVLMCRIKSHDQLVVEVKRLQQSLVNDEAEQANGKLLNTINRLGRIKMTRQILVETRIGKSVAKLKSRDSRVTQKAQELTRKWRAIAEAEKKNAGSSQSNGYSLAYTVLVIKEGGANQFHVEENVSADCVKYRSVGSTGKEEHESSNSTITTATGLC